MNSLVWTTAETSFLKEHYKDMSMHNLVNALNKTDIQIYNKIYRMQYEEIPVVKPKHFVEYMPFTIEEEEPFEDVRKRDYKKFFENYKIRTAQ